jgi:omega-amidase
MNIALCSLDQFWEDKQKNRSKCLSAITRAKAGKADVIIFPEMTMTGFSMNTGLIAEGFKKSDTLNWFREQARIFEIYIVFGIVITGKRKPLNSCIVINRTGSIVGLYAKVHTFSYADEDQHYDRGAKIAACKIMTEKIGLTICYDLRYPEVYTSLAKSCSAILNIANWPAERIDHWTTLLRARAIENQLYIFGVNRRGIDGKGIKYIKSSIAVSPRGEIIPPDSKGNDLDLYSIDFNAVKSYRKVFPALKDRRPSIYKKYL